MTNSRANKTLTVFKTADETVNSSTVMQNDDHLFTPVKASTSYYVQIVIFFESGATPDIKTAITLPSGGTGIVDLNHLCAEALSLTASWLTPVTMGSAAGTNMLQMTGKVVISTTAGTLNFQWAQVNSDAGDTKVLIGSKLEITEIK